METVIMTIPFDPEKEIFQDEEWRKFLINKKVRQVRPEFFQTKNKAYWTIFAEHETVLRDHGPRQSRVQLTEADQLLFNRLRVWRANKAEREGIPVFIVATNRELAEIVTRKAMTFEALKTIKGFGKKKLELHGREVIDIVKAFHSRVGQHESGQGGYA